MSVYATRYPYTCEKVVETGVFGRYFQLRHLALVGIQQAEIVDRV